MSHSNGLSTKPCRTPADTTYFWGSSFESYQIATDNSSEAQSLPGFSILSSNKPNWTHFARPIFAGTTLDCVLFQSGNQLEASIVDLALRNSCCRSEMHPWFSTTGGNRMDITRSTIFSTASWRLMGLKRNGSLGGTVPTSAAPMLWEISSRTSTPRSTWPTCPV